MTSVNDNTLHELELDYKKLALLLIGAAIGSFLEFFCFGLVGYFEDEIVTAFFPPSNTSMLESFTLFGIAFVFRPIGGLLFGHIGDKYGRVYSFRISLALMSISSFLFAFIPNYSTIGYWSTALAFILRAVQGFSVGGEMSTALVYIMEQAPKHIRGTLIGILWCFSSGTYLSLVVFVIWNDTSSSYSSSSWTWRIPFACTIFIGMFGFVIRRFMPVSQEFQAMVDQNMVVDNPIWSTIQEYPKETVILLCVYVFPAMAYYAIAIWVPAYLQSSAHQSYDEYAYDVMLVTGILICVENVIGGWMSDRYGNYNCVKHALAFFVPFLFINLTLMSVTDNVVLISICQLLLSTFGLLSPMIVIWCVNFVTDARIRNTITGFTYNCGMALFVSTLMDVLTALADIDVKFGGMIAGAYLCVFGVICLGGIVYGEKGNSKMWGKYEFIDNSEFNDDDEDNKEDTQFIL